MKINSALNNQFSFNNKDLFEGIPEAICKKIKARMVTTYFKAGQSIFKEGQQPNGIYRVKKGKVKKSTQTNFGAQHLFYVCTEKEYLGYHSVLSQETYPDSAVALVDSEIEFIAQADFLSAVDASHLLSQRLLKNLSHEFRVFINATKMLAKHTVRERSALNLLILESKFRQENQEETEIIMNRDDLASMVGTAKESVVRMLKDFKDEGLIITKRSSIFIKNYSGLLKVANFQ